MQQPSEAVELKAREYVLEHGIPEYFEGFGFNEAQQSRQVIIRLPSQTQEGISYTSIYHAQGAFCTCPAHFKGYTCWHLVIAQAIYNGDEPWKKRTLEEFRDTSLFTSKE